MKHKIVEVLWVDSAAIRGWRSTESVLADSQEDDYLACKTTGYLLARSEDRTIIAQNLSKDGENVSDVITIPNQAITTISVVDFYRAGDGQADRQTAWESAFYGKARD